MTNFLGSTGVKFLLVIIAVIFSIFFFVRENNLDSQNTYVVGEHTVEKAVLLSGSVKATSQVNLSFDAVGKVSTTTVSQGDQVVEGQILAELDHSVLKADLLQAQGKVRSAQANVSLVEASVQKAKANLSLIQAQNRGTDSSVASAETVLRNTINEQETLVQNAYSDLLNNDLTAYPVDNYKSVTAPIVSGNYTGENNGEYVLDFYNSGGSTGYSVRVNGLENETISFDDFGMPSSLGTSGLYLTLPESGESEAYGNTDWVVPVPNKRSTTYQTKLGAYNKALQTQSLAVGNAQVNLDNLIAQQENGTGIAITTAQEQQALAALQEANANLNQSIGALAQAEAGVARIGAQIENSLIRAPFSGVIARFDYEVGESVSLGQDGVTIITDGAYELEMSIPEIDVARVAVGDEAEIILDAYGKDIVWKGVLTEIELVETEIDGVPSYSSVITIVEPDERIKIGMNARARIVVDKKTDVIAIPASYVTTVDNTSTVMLLENKNEIVEKIVSTGIKGTDSFVEIAEGLAVGDRVLAPTKK